MLSNKNKIIAAAQKYVQRGAYDKAIREYQRVVEEDPRDVRTLLKIGDLQAKKGDLAQAARTYERVAQTYSEQGFYLKAVAVYKQILKIDPSQVEINRRLAELYHQLGLLSDSMAQYQALAASYERQGKPKDALAVYRRMVELDPDNVAARVKLAELFSRENDNAAAVREFERACEQLQKQGRLEDYVKVAERLIYLDPAKVGVARRLAQVYLERGDTRRALAKLQLCFKADPRDVDTLRLLADAFRELGQIPKTVSVLKELATILDERGMRAERDDVWRRVLELVPDDADARQALGGAAAAVQQVPPDVEEQVRKLLLETDVLVKYGLFQKAREHLSRLFRLAPEHPEALERLRDVSIELGDPAGAVGALLRLADQRRGDPVLFRETLLQALRLDPGNPQVVEAWRQTGEPIPGVAAPEVELELVEEEPGPEPAPPNAEEEILIVDGGDASDETVFGLPPAALEASAAAPARPVGEAGPEAGPPDERTLVVPVSALASEDEVAGSAGPAAAVRERTDAEVDSELEEAEFFLHQGLFEEARLILADLARARPKREDIQARLREVEARLTVEGPSSTPAPPVEEVVIDELFEDLTAPLESPVSPEDAETHYDLGMAYKEMGLLDDAIHEFRLAMRGPSREFSALERFAACYVEKGLFDEAVEHLKRGLSSPRLTDPAAIELYFALGAAYEAMGDSREALYYYRRVSALAGEFRDVRQRIERLKGADGLERGRRLDLGR